MKTIVYTHYGSPDVLHLEEVEKPMPKDRRSSGEDSRLVSQSLDWHMMRATPFLARLENGAVQTKKPQTRRRHRGAGRSGGQRRHAVSAR